MKKGAVSVRFSEDLSAILKRIAAVYETSDVAVVRWAVKALGVYHDSHGHLPPMEAVQKSLVLEEPPAAPGAVREADAKKSRKPARTAAAQV